MAQNEIRKDGAHPHKIARISILENDILFERYGRFLSLLQIVQLCLKVPYLVQEIYFTSQKWSLLFYFVLECVLALFIEMQRDSWGCGPGLCWCGTGLSLSLNCTMLCFTSWWSRKTTNKLHGPHVLETTPTQHEKKWPHREHQCGAGQVPFKGQVRISYNSRVSEWVNYVYLD